MNRGARKKYTIGEGSNNSYKGSPITDTGTTTTINMKQRREIWFGNPSVVTPVLNWQIEKSNKHVSWNSDRYNNNKHWSYKTWSDCAVSRDNNYGNKRTVCARFMFNSAPFTVTADVYWNGCIERTYGDIDAYCIGEKVRPAMYNSILRIDIVKTIKRTTTRVGTRIKCDAFSAPLYYTSYFINLWCINVWLTRPERTRVRWWMFNGNSLGKYCT